MFIDGKVKLFGVERENSNKECTKMLYTESKSINTFYISGNIFLLVLMMLGEYSACPELQYFSSAIKLL
jgi:hypothetical protein